VLKVSQLIEERPPGVVIIENSLEDHIADVCLWARPVLLLLLPGLILLSLLPTPVKLIDFFQRLGPNLQKEVVIERGSNTYVKLKLFRLLTEPCDTS
jgi:hypothetical protein